MIYATHPGRLGDLLWALPTVRALSQQYGQPINLWLAPQCKPLVNLLQKQPYIGDVRLDYDWQVQDTAPASPRLPPKGPAQGSVIHLGYQQWPERPLPFEIAHHAQFRPTSEYWDRWITAVPLPDVNPQIVFHWTDRWFELKLGLTEIVTDGIGLHFTWRLRYAESSRWESESAGRGSPALLENVARLLASPQIKAVVTDCSAVHVLAAAMGKTVLVVEPESDRHHPIFWPGSTQVDGRWQPADNPLGQRIRPVLGIDGKPTFDARHLKDAIREVLQ